MKRFDKGTEARRAARNKAAKAPSTRKIEDKRKKAPRSPRRDHVYPDWTTGRFDS